MLGLVALAVLGAAPGPWGEFGIAGSGSYGSGGGLTSYSGMGLLTLSGFLHHRLHDDDSPLSLQPYLQRASSLGGEVSASGFSTDGQGLPEPYHGTTFAGSVSLDAYTGPVLTLFASAEFARVTTGGGFVAGSVYLLPRATFGPGLRFGDTRLTLGYEYAPTIKDGTYDGRGFGELYLRITTVFGGRLYVSALGEVILSGGLGLLELAVFPSTTFGLGASMRFAQGAIYFDSRQVFRQWEPAFSLTWWVTPRGALGIGYRFTHSEPVDGGGTPFDTHQFSLAFAFRLE